MGTAALRPKRGRNTCCQPKGPFLCFFHIGVQKFSPALLHLPDSPTVWSNLATSGNSRAGLGVTGSRVVSEGAGESLEMALSPPTPTTRT